MSDVAVVTDTTHYLPREMVERHGIHQVSLYVNWNGRMDKESDLPDFNGFYDHLVTAPELPTTSQPSVGDFLAVYEPLLEDGKDIVSLHLSGGISGTVQSAEQARDELVRKGIDRNRIVVVDSATACGGLGFLVLAAAAAVQGGASAADAAQAARSTRATLKTWFAIDTMEFLKRGGRVGAAQAWLGSTLRIKPILTLEHEITPVERVRTAGRAVDRLIDYLRSRKEDGCDAWAVQHIQDPIRADGLVDAGREIFGTDPLFCSEVGPVIGTHIGPGLLGVAGVPSQLLSGLR